MKKIKILFLTLFVCFSSYAQDPQLFENDWYLQKVIIDDIEHFPPFSSLVGRLYLSLENIGVAYPHCEEGFEKNIEYFPNNLFSTENGGIIFIGICGDPEKIEYMNKHYSIYYDLETEIAKNQFSYSFTAENGILTLTIVNTDGDKAIYGNELLSTQDLDSSSFSMYPNPVKELLQITNKSNIAIAKIKIHDILGRLVFQKNNPTSQLDVSGLASSLLLVQIETDKGTVVKKIVKE